MLNKPKKLTLSVRPDQVADLEVLQLVLESFKVKVDKSELVRAALDCFLLLDDVDIIKTILVEAHKSLKDSPSTI